MKKGEADYWKEVVVEARLLRGPDFLHGVSFSLTGKIPERARNENRRGCIC